MEGLMEDWLESHHLRDLRLRCTLSREDSRTERWDVLASGLERDTGRCGMDLKGEVLIRGVD